MVINQGDVFWVDLGLPIGSSPGFRHPYVVIQNNAFNHSRISTVVICAVTSNLRHATARGNVALKVGEANLKKESVVLVPQLLTVDKSQLDEYIGSLSAQRIRQILDGIGLVIEPREVK